MNNGSRSDAEPFAGLAVYNNSLRGALPTWSDANETIVLVNPGNPDLCGEVGGVEQNPSVSVVVLPLGSMAWEAVLVLLSVALLCCWFSKSCQRSFSMPCVACTGKASRALAALRASIWRHRKGSWLLYCAHIAAS